MDIRRKILQSYPIVLDMLKCRGYDTSMYAPLTSEMVETCEHAQFVEPIVVRRRYIYGEDTSGYECQSSRPEPVSPEEGCSRPDGSLYSFCGSDDAWENAVRGQQSADISIVSRELRVIAEWTATHVEKVRGTQKFRSLYPVLTKLLDLFQTGRAPTDDAGEQEGEDGGGENGGGENGGAEKISDEMFSKVIGLYRRSAIPIAEVHYCCFMVSKLSLRREMEVKRLDAMQSTLETDVLAQHVETFKDLAEQLGDDFAKEIEQEVTRVYQGARTTIIVAKNPKKVVAESDKVRAQIFDIQNLLYDIRKHMYVPRHEIIDTWQQDQLVQQIKGKYHISRLSGNLPIIYTTDPVAKFIGLTKNNLCKITRTNDSSGTYVIYRYCL